MNATWSDKALDVLIALSHTDEGCPSEIYGDRECMFCSAWLELDEEHSDDCLTRHVEKLIAEADSMDRVARGTCGARFRKNRLIGSAGEWRWPCGYPTGVSLSVYLGNDITPEEDGHTLCPACGRNEGRIGRIGWR